MANRTILGKNNLNKYGLYVSKPGINVDQASLPEHYSFNSDWSAGAVIHATGTIGVGQYVYFPSLPYIPLVMSWGIKADGSQAGRYRLSWGYAENYWVPGLSEYESEYYSISYEGPKLENGYGHIYFPPFSKQSWSGDIHPNAKYVILRTPVI